MSTTQTAFVSAATGTLGLNVARRLRLLGWSVHATVRTPTSPAAQTLASLGVILTRGDWDTPSELAAALAGCTHLFLNTVPSFPPADITHERVQASTILALATAAGVRHVVYSSTLAIDRLEEVTVFDPDSFVGKILLNKAAVEEELKGKGFETWTVLRGATFMENFLPPKVAMYFGLVQTGTWTMALLPGAKMPLVGADDIAKFAVAVFEDPARFAGGEIAIAGDELSAEEIMEVLSEVAGKELKFAALTDDEIAAQRASNPLIVAQLALRELGKFVKAEESRAWGISLVTFKEFSVNNKDLIQQTYL
ncbi:hypothetical protein B0H67DRAFT_242325 [Lasiosphaeris hirsuta]|uniref:NmrA-like domain-containing protein n=1 Tax=Lasiosphaeris hirsuta TaxID=260670 RepID=A0AA40AGT1_9PEZI|nr:hypothetical protein B0H67DRAFT_242325 [Lasiosphaeris hirsuta]